MKWLTHDMRVNPSGSDAPKGMAHRPEGVRVKFYFDLGYDTAAIADKLELSEAEVVRRLGLSKRKANA
jgi:hypothetical protein